MSTLTLSTVRPDEDFARWKGARWPYPTVRPFRNSDLPTQRTPYTPRGTRVVSYYLAVGPVYGTLTASTDQRLAYLTRPSEDRFPYPLKPKGWTRATDPFEVEARRRAAL